MDGVVAGQSGNAFDVGASEHEHVAVERGHDEEHGEEHGHQADYDGGGVWVNDEHDAAASAERPDATDDAASAPHGHDVVVPQGVEDSDVPVDSDGQQAAHRRHHRDADHGVEHVVHLTNEVILHHQLPVVQEVNDDALPGVGHTHQHVRNGQTADKEVHGRVQVFVFDDGCNNQDVFKQRDDSQDQKHLYCDVHLLARRRLGRAALVGQRWGRGVVVGIVAPWGVTQERLLPVRRLLSHIHGAGVRSWSQLK